MADLYHAAFGVSVAGTVLARLAGPRRHARSVRSNSQ